MESQAKTLEAQWTQLKQSLASKSPTHTREHPTVTKLFSMGQGKLGRGTRQHKKATPNSSPCQNEQTTRVGWNFCSCMTHVIPVLSWHTRTKKCKKSSIFFCFFTQYPPGLGISKIRDLFFRGSIWIRLKNRGSFCVGQVPGTSHVATRPKMLTCERRASVPRCRGFLQPAPLPDWSWLSRASLMWYVYQVQR